jgi:predicted ATPase/tetratricopeptide (TPR) repeat protein
MDSVGPWRVRTFGGFSVERGGVRHDRFRTRHAAALLAFLALKPDVRHSREVLAEHLWPDAPPLAARQRLSTALTTLRRELEATGPPVFTGGRESVGVQPGMLTSDAAEFDRLIRQARNASRERRRELLREARELAEAGEFLPGFYFEWAVERSARFEEALDAVRAELEAEADVPALPAEDPSSLVGRAAEIESLDRLILERPRCIGILGAGGVGKTRLALDLFERHARRFPGASVFVRLAEVRHPSDFLPAVARALRLAPGDGEPSLRAISAALAVPALVVLDNLEHLLPGVHADLDRLVRACGPCVFVGTSRRRLGIAGERVLRVRPLRLPSASARPEEMADAPAIRLFLARYQEAGGAPVPPKSLPAVEEICRALGGLPLAIQLAASASVSVGLNALRPDTMLHRLLPRRDPDATNPHASLGDMIEWSLTLLDPATRQALDAVAVLPGAFTFRLVRDLYGDDVAAVLPRLHGDSLLEADGHGAMRVLEPIRDHVQAQMAPDARTEWELRLVRRCAELAGELEAKLEGPDQGAATEEITPIWPTMRRAIQLAHERRLPTEGLRIVTGLSRTFIVYFTAREAIALAEPLLEMPGLDPHVRARALAVLARHHRNLGHNDAAFRYGAECVALAQAIGEVRAEARGTAGQAYMACIREDQPEALRLASRASELGRRIGDVETQALAQLVAGHAHCLFRKEATEDEARRAHAASEAHFEAAAAIAREARDDMMEAVIQFHRSAYAGADLDLYHARLNREIEIHRKNGWKLHEAMARATLVRRLYTAVGSVDFLAELRSLQEVYAECHQWEARAEQVAAEAEILFRMDRYEEARAAMEDALGVLQRHERAVVEYHVQALIYGALGMREMEIPLLALVERGGRDEFSAMLAELARALLEARRGEVEAAFRRLRRFTLESKPTRVQHAYADTWVAFADLVAEHHPGLALAAYRRSRPIYREIKSAVDLRRVRMRVAERVALHRAASA